MMKCPYVPPHPWNVDFPHLMLRAKAHKFTRGTCSTGARPAAHLHRPHRQARDDPGRGAGGERAANSKPLRALGEKVAGVSTRTRGCRSYAPRTFRAARRRARAIAGARRRAHAGQGRGLLDLLRELQRAGHRPRPAEDPRRTTRFPYVLVEKEACCGMPKLELGDLESRGRSSRRRTSRALATLAREGYAILTPVPSCTLMFKQELPLMFPDDADVQRGARRDVRSVRVPRGAPARRPAEDRLHAAARQGRLPRALPLARAEDRAARRRRRWSAVPGHRGARRSSAARATRAPRA